MSQDEQEPPGADAARPWQCRDLCLCNDDLAGSSWGLTSEVLLSCENAGFSLKELLWGVLISVAVTELFFLFHGCPRSCSHCLTPTFLVACQTLVFVIAMKDVGTVIPFLQVW